MSLTLDEKITALEVEIGGYQVKLNDPSKLASHETLEMIFQSFNTSRAYLTELTKQKTVILQSPPAAAVLSPVATTSVFASTILAKLGLEFDSIPEIPLVDGVQTLSINIPEGGWKNEYHFNSYMFPLLSTIFDGRLINSERHPWLEVEGGTARNDLRPDFFYWPLGPDCLIETKQSPKQNPVEDCVYGCPMKNCAFMVDVILDGKVTEFESIPLSEIGKLFKYLDTMSMCRNQFPRGLFYNHKEFIVASYSAGSIQSIFRGYWNTTGCVEAIRSYLDLGNVNGTVSALRHFLQVNDGSRVHLALGRGRFGCVFKVSLSSHAAKQFALKVVSTEAGNPTTIQEYEKIVAVSSIHPTIVACVVPNSLVQTQDFVYYVLDDLGKHGVNIEIPARKAFMKLVELHQNGVVHGDPRIANVIQLSDGSLRWIDLRLPVGTIGQDVKILIESVFNKTIAENEQVQERVLHYRHEPSVERMTIVYNFCKNLVQQFRI